MKGTLQLQSRIEAARQSQAERIRLVYLLAASHSGSTLLGMLLGAHPDVCCVGELKLTSLGDVEQYLCSCRTLIRNCSFWNAVREEMKSHGIAFDIADPGTDMQWQATRYISRLLRPLHRGPVLEKLRDFALNCSPQWRKNLSLIQARNLSLLKSIAALTGRHTIVDSSKIGLRLKYLLRIPELDIRVIRLVRDGRAVSLTYTDPAAFADCRNPDLRGGGAGASRDRERLSMRNAAREWRRSNEEAEAVLAQIDPSHWIQIRYEDLCAHPQQALARIFNFLELDPDRRSTNFRAASHHVLGNGMRLDDTTEIRLDDRWRTALSADQLFQFESIAGVMNRRLGYQS